MKQATIFSRVSNNSTNLLPSVTMIWLCGVVWLSTSLTVLKSFRVKSSSSSNKQNAFKTLLRWYSSRSPFYYTKTRSTKSSSAVWQVSYKLTKFINKKHLKKCSMTTIASSWVSMRTETGCLLTEEKWLFLIFIMKCFCLYFSKL